jgi:hypothetical protein
MAQSCNPSTLEAKQEHHEFETSLCYIANSRPAWASWDVSRKLKQKAKYPQWQGWHSAVNLTNVPLPLDECVCGVSERREIGRKPSNVLFCSSFSLSYSFESGSPYVSPRLASSSQHFFLSPPSVEITGTHTTSGCHLVFEQKALVSG